MTPLFQPERQSDRRVVGNFSSPKKAFASVRLNCGADMAPAAGKETLCFRIHFSTHNAGAPKLAQNCRVRPTTAFLRHSCRSENGEASHHSSHAFA